MGKLILSKKDYIKVKNEIICYVGSDDLFYAEYCLGYPFDKKNGYFYKGDLKALTPFYGNNEKFDESDFGVFIYKSLFNENNNFIEYKPDKDTDIDCISKERIVDKKRYLIRDSEFLKFISFIYNNQDDNELFFTISKPEIKDNKIRIQFKNQHFYYIRDAYFDLEYEKFENFIDNLTKYKDLDYYKNEDGYHFILLNSPEEDVSRLRNLISNNDIYSIYLDDNVIYLKYKKSSNKSIFELFSSLNNEEIKNIINENDGFKAIDSYYYIPHSL